MQYHSFFELHQLPHGELTSLHLTWLRTPIPNSSKHTPWRLICSHHIHDGGLRARYDAYGEFRLSQQTQHIRQLNSSHFTCAAPPCSCQAANITPTGFREGDCYATDEASQWGDIGRTSASRRRDRKRPIHTTRPCCSDRMGPGSGAHVFPQDTAFRSERLREPFSQPRSRAPPPQPPIQTPTSRQLSEAWGTYQERCRVMSLISRGKSPKKRQLTFSSIPWPVFGAVTRLSDLNPAAIQSFLCAHNCDESERRARVKNALLTFHPDKTSRWFSCLRSEDVAIVQEALNIVTHHLTTILHSF